ncbi:hypothetical protein MUP77_12905 [Candidatus Bathyarchaeota archaeon]|nr:hypothetical protein [Candidatus Bathyarchaeota archaeon]
MAEEKKTESFEEKMMRAHSRFLEDVGKVYPLAVLGSLCIAISAFTKDTYPQAQAYSVVAASLFLIAFVSSLLTRVMGGDLPAFTSIASTAVAIFFLFLVVIEFARAISLVGKTLLIVPFLFMVITFFSGSIAILRFSQKVKSTLIVICGTIAIGTISLFWILLTIFLVGELTEIRIFPRLNNNFMNAVILIGAVFLMITWLLFRKESKKGKTKISMISEGP